MSRRWIKLPEPLPEQVNSLQQELKINRHLVTLLVQRGITNLELARFFFRPALEHLHDPFLMKDMDKAVERVHQALEKGERILVYGDYDADGTTAVALVYSFFSQLTPNIDYYIPDRHTEGYGITRTGIAHAQEQGFNLVIALDCGIKSVELVKEANQLGIDMIICDHHLPGDSLPAAVAVLDPKRADCGYPYKELSGCGIGFKLVQAYNTCYRDEQEDIYRFLDLLTVSIAADIVQITGENRVLAYYGLQRLAQDPSMGLKMLTQHAIKRSTRSISDVVFAIGPRINAAGRIADAKAAVRLMLCSNPKEAEDFARLIDQHNMDRKTFDTEITGQALDMIMSSSDMLQRKSTVLFNPGWHKGVIGIVASRVIEQHYKPTIILTESNGKATGSARSVKGFDIHQAIDACADLLEQYGGHTHAAGLTLKLENVEPFIRKFEEVVSRTISEASLTPEMTYDLEISLDEITPAFLKLLMQFAPFGPGNMAPVFLTRSVADGGYGRVLKEQHLKMNLVPVNGGPAFDAIAFGMSGFYEAVQQKQPMDILYTIEENEYNGQTSIQLMIKDMRLSAGQA